MFRTSSTYWVFLVILATSTCNVIVLVQRLNEACHERHYNGTCKIITSCPFAMAILKINDTKTLHEIFCGFEKKIPKVCCPNTDDSIIFKNNETDETEKYETSTLKLEFTTRISTDISGSEDSSKTENTFDTEESSVFPNRKICGIQADEDKIVGGEIATVDEFPWLARIKYQSDRGDSFACSGTLITDQHVLTAAHCLQMPGKILSVRLGEWDDTKDNDCFEGKCNDYPVDRGIEKIIVYPEFNPKDHTRYDIGIIKLDKPVNFTEFITPICLPTTPYVARQDSLADGRYQTAGWGITEFGTVSAVKRKVSLSAVPFTICKSTLSGLTPESENYIICAGGKKGKDSCQGDSGGPLMRIVSEDYRTNWYLFGITSYGSKRCGSEGFPGVYTRVSRYMEWIRQNVT